MLKTKISKEPILSFISFYVILSITQVLLIRIVVQTDTKTRENPCVPSPCGPNSQCRIIGDQAACSCLVNYVGRPPNCRPECTTHSECANNLACQNEKCINPCPGSCGLNAICTVVNHNPACSCLPGFTGDALIACEAPPSCKIYRR